MKPLHIILSLAIVFTSASAFAKEVSYRKLLELNGENISAVEQGMSEAQVRDIMGAYTSKVPNGPVNNPWKTESLGELKVLHYLVRRNPPFTPLLENQAEPVILKNGKVVAIGRSYLRTARETVAESTFSGQDRPVEERLKTLQELYDSGAIDKATYKKQKQRILDSI